MKNKILNQLENQSLFQIKKIENNILVNPLNEAAFNELIGFAKLLNEIYTKLISKHANVSQQLKKEIELLLEQTNITNKIYLLIDSNIFRNQTFFIKSFLYEKKILKKLKVKKLPKEIKHSIESLYSIMDNILICYNE